MVDHLQPRKVVVFECHARALQLFDGGSDVRHPKADRRMVGLGAFGLREKREGRATHRTDELAVGLEAPEFTFSSSRPAPPCALRGPLTSSI